MRVRFLTLALVFGLLAACEAAEEPVDSGENLDVPFTSQAPERNWQEPWLNACEETSILMVDLYYEAEGEPSTEEAKQRILEIVEGKRQAIDPSLDESLETIAQLIEELELDWRVEIVEDPTLEDMLEELENERPIIVPVYAPELNNPYYSGGGPDYHVMVLTGYNQETQSFIINDPGTQYGDELSFTYETLMDSIHDLRPEDYDGGAKRVLYTSPR